MTNQCFNCGRPMVVKRSPALGYYDFDCHSCGAHTAMRLDALTSQERQDVLAASEKAERIAGASVGFKRGGRP